MSRSSAIRELVLLRILTFVREPEALFWTFGFPILMAIGLGLAFNEEPNEPIIVGIEAGTQGEAHRAALAASDEIEARVLQPEEAEQALRRGEVGLLLSGQSELVYRYDPTRPESRMARLVTDRAVQRFAGAEPAVSVTETAEVQPGSRYIDWVIPGLIGLNLMSTGMWGIGFGIVNMRQKKQLKRMVSTPMRRSDFLLAQMIARLAFLVLEIPPIIVFAWLAFNVQVAGSLLSLLVVILLGTLTFAGLGLLASSRARTIEGVSGILNVVMLPMFVLSGIFFSASRFPDAIQPVVQALPLTALNDALRVVYNDGLPISSVPGELAILIAWAVGSFFIALRLFRWQ